MPAPRLRPARPVRFATASLVAALALLSACQVPGGTGTGPGTAASKKPVREDAPRTTASSTPSAAPSAAASATPLPGTSAGPVAPVGTPAGQPTLLPSAAASAGNVEPVFLKKPAGASTLSGVVRLDASYMVSTGAGNILSHNGGVMVAAGGGNILSHNGGQILSHNGGVMVAAGGGNILSHNGGVMVAAGAGHLVAAGGGNLVAAGGGNLVSAGGLNFQLLQASAEPSATPTASATPAGAAPAFGTIAPAAGVEIGVWSIERRGFLPIGVDDAGKPVYTVYTNLEGKYELYMPPEEQGTGIVVAVVDRKSDDPRLNYGVLTPIDNPKEVAIDEDTVLVTSYVREALGARLRASITNPNTAEIVDEIGGDAARNNAALVALLTTFIDDFGKAGRALGLDKDPEKAKAAVRRATDYAFKDLDLADVPRTVRPTWYDVTVEEQPIDVLLDILRTLRANATAKLAADPGFAAKTSFMPKINARRVADKLPPYEVLKAADFGQIAVDEYLTILDNDRLKALIGPKDTKFADVQMYKALRTLLRELGALGLPQALGDRARDDEEKTWVIGSGRGNDNIDRLNVAVQNILFKTLSQILAMSAEEHAEMRARLAEPTP